jgi:hypothetical protein
MDAGICKLLCTRVTDGRQHMIFLGLDFFRREKDPGITTVDLSVSPYINIYLLPPFEITRRCSTLILFNLNNNFFRFYLSVFKALIKF